jgi:flagellar basal body rod protein FlgG
MLPVVSSPLSAIRSFTRGLLVSANNVANSQTEDFRASDTVYLSQPGGGVAADVVQRPQMPPGPENGVDLVEETVNQMSDSRAIEANLAVIRASDKTLGVLLDTVG